MSAGQLTDTGGHYARISLLDASAALKSGQIDALVTAPIHKSNVQGENFNYTGHTPFLRDFFGAEEVVMLMVADNGCGFEPGGVGGGGSATGTRGRSSLSSPMLGPA